jgi:hypothetical protein
LGEFIGQADGDAADLGLLGRRAADAPDVAAVPETAGGPARRRPTSGH